jgi:outer membrane protein OmpA-like peptidoglycan-associated protein
MRIFLAAAVTALVLSACTPTSYVVLLENEDGSTGKVIVEGKEGSSTLDSAGQGAALDGSSEKPFKVEQDTIDNVFAAAISAKPITPVSFMLYFLHDSVEMRTDSEVDLNLALKEMEKRKAADISVIGHADRAGDEEYNHQLALKRASAIADRIRAADVKVADITVTSHGENNPIVPTADGVSEPKNRRVQVTVR